MTREEAIEVLKDIYNYTRFDTYTTNEARTMAIKALEQEPCEDAISRQAVLNYTDKILNCGMGKKKSFEFIKKFVEKSASITPKREQGEWIQKEYWSEGCGMGETYGYYYECSECGNLTQGDYDKCGLNYCPNCGAKMVEPQKISDTNMKMWEDIYAEEERRTTER